jgi:methyl-accepting chemotaxis protein
VSDVVGEIAGASRDQSAGIDQVNKAVVQIDEMTQQNAALVEQARAADSLQQGERIAPAGLLVMKISKKLVLFFC